jgi:hypothetical protein
VNPLEDNFRVYKVTGGKRSAEFEDKEVKHLTQRITGHAVLDALRSIRGSLADERSQLRQRFPPIFRQLIQIVLQR